MSKSSPLIDYFFYASILEIYPPITLILSRIALIFLAESKSSYSTNYSFCPSKSSILSFRIGSSSSSLTVIIFMFLGAKSGYSSSTWGYYGSAYGAIPYASGGGKYYPGPCWSIASCSYSERGDPWHAIPTIPT